MRMPILKIRPPAQTAKAAKRIIPARPAQGCQAGTTTGVPRRIIMTMGVQMGMSDIAVARVPSGSRITGRRTNIGIIAGIMAGKDNCWASF